MGREFEEALTKAAMEAAQLHGEKEKLEKRLVEVDARGLTLSQTIAALGQLVDRKFMQDVQTKYDVVLAAKLGLKEACLQILRAKSPKALTAAEVKTTMQSIGYSSAKYANFIAVIEVTLKRLVPNEATEVLVGGKKAYKYLPPTTESNAWDDLLKLE